MSLFSPAIFFADTPIIAVTDDGDAAPDSGGGTAAHTYNSKTSTGPFTIIAITYQNTDDLRTISSVTWGGNAMTSVYAPTMFDDGANPLKLGAAFFYRAGAQSSGNIVITFSDTVTDSEITIISLTNLQSPTAVATDSEGIDQGTTAQVDLDSLGSPGAGGVRLAAFVAANDGNAISWANGTEIADLDAGSHRHGVAYDLGDDATSIAPSADSTDTKFVIGVSLR